MWSDKTTGSELTHGASLEATDTLHLTSREQTTSASLTSKSQAIASPNTDTSRRKMSSSPSVVFPSTGSKTLVTITSVATSEAASMTEQLSQTSSPAEVSSMSATTAPAPSVTTTVTTMGTNSVLITTPNPGRRDMASASAVAPTLPASSPSPSASVISALSTDMPRTPSMWGTSSESVTSSASGLSQSSVEIRATSEASTTAKSIHTPENTAVTHVGTLSSSRESQSSAPAGSETTPGTSPNETSSLSGDTMASTLMPGFSATTETETQSKSSLVPEPQETIMSLHTSSAPEETTVLSEVSTGTSAEASSADVISPSRTSIPGPDRPTMSPDIPTNISNRLSISPVISESHVGHEHRRCDQSSPRSDQRLSGESGHV
ncbi:mucin-16-like [Suricata suricatta]|uniref:mucin-16-like n=1 Tax=Suricata suricatta TaxID=37032 RepID=UPI00115547C8|nr:mucin-16-like [Suricata suricatta]